jgi:hypothetical protein
VGVSGGARGQTRPEAGFGAGAPGSPPAMSDDRVEQRAADLLPEERTAGSADPEAQAAAILADSDEREERPGAAPGTFLEHRTSDQTVMPGDGTR